MGLEFHDNNAIPGMSHMATKFLQVIKQRADEAQIGIDLQPKQDRKTQEYFLEAVIKFRALLGSGYPIRLRVHATPRGSLLHVGYMVSTDEMPAFQWAISDGNKFEDAMRSGVNMKPENQRELTIIMDSFQQAVYGPTVRDLLAAAEASRRPQGGAGFLGNQ